MLLYSFWAKQTLNYQSPEGSKYHLVAYAGSDASLLHAQEQAIDVLRQRCLALERGKTLGQYPSGTKPLREKLEQRIVDATGQETGAITQNRYGSRVQNTRRVMLLDVDNADLQKLATPRVSLMDWLQRIFSSRPPVAPLEPQAYLEQQLRQWLQQRPDWYFRVYRTRAGFRLLATHALIEPNGPEALEVFRTLPVDATYARLCQNQACYRARLTPKPWRIGVTKPAHAFPFDTPDQAQEHALWDQTYTQQSQSFAVCDLLTTMGSGRVSSEVQPLIDIHDEACLGRGELA